MDVFSVLSLLGGLALSLFGMNIMSGGLERIAGGKLEHVLERSTNSRLKGVLLGAGVTAIIQSSSATTVMAVGFVNSGIMKLSQAIGIIMGANIGTTITSWILSLSGVQGDSFVVQLLKPTSFAPIFAVIGVALLLFSKKRRRINIGTILCGFATLMLGMSTMTSAVEPLGSMPEFMNLMTMFENPLLGVLAGAVLTGVIQSSAASIGILQALSMTGGITYGMAIPIILGQNIGTCVTALLSCIGASKNAKRTALVHLYFNIIGTLLFLVLFYAGNAIFRFSFINQALNPANIAVVHTIFNVLCTAVLFPFSNQLAWLAKHTIPDAPSENREMIRLDERFIGMPSFALVQCKRVADEMAKLAHDTFLLAIASVRSHSTKHMVQVLKNEQLVDRYEDMLGAYLVKLSGEQLLSKDSRTVGELLHVIGDFERISDHATNIIENVREMEEKNLFFTEAAAKELEVFFGAIEEIISLAFDSFITQNTGFATQVEPLEDVIDGLYAEMRARHIERLQRGECTIQQGFLLSDLLTNLERVSDHCSNIAACMIQTQNKKFDMHSYIEAIKAPGSPAFGESMQRFAEKYELPPV